MIKGIGGITLKSKNKSRLCAFIQHISYIPGNRGIDNCRSKSKSARGFPRPPCRAPRWSCAFSGVEWPVHSPALRSRGPCDSSVGRTTHARMSMRRRRTSSRAPCCCRCPSEGPGPPATRIVAASAPPI